jgi:4-amino-4-deoxy-L-arabinose transferase-like glycosyltransferase
VHPPNRTPIWHFLVVLAACAAVYWPFLGSNGFGASEGHRVGPAWEMLRTGDFVHLKLFSQTYLRKPPGMPWAIALSSSILGQTEFAARAVSALASTLMALLACRWTNRWLGPPWGMAAGLAQALAPLFMMVGRTAEIDPLNCLGTQMAALGLLALVRDPRLLWGASAWVAGGAILAGIAKGPASLPVLAGVIGGACVVARSVRPLRVPGVWMSLVSSAVALAAFGAWFADVNRDPDAVRQDFSEFTWSLSRLAGTVGLPFTSFLAAFPASLALVVLVLHQREERNRRQDPTLTTARLLAWSWLLSVAALMMTGSSNPRYAMPAGVLLAPMAAWALRACWLARRESAGARVVMLGHPAVLGGVMLVGSVGWVLHDQGRGRHDQGREAGRAIAEALPDGAEVWANDVVEARPDILLYAVRGVGRRGGEVHPRWRKRAMVAGELPPDDAGAVYMLLRSDPESPEWARYLPEIERGRLERVAGGSIAKYTWELVRWRGGAGVGGASVVPAAGSAAEEESSR